ncbi:MAG: hypothetical protein ACREB9_05680 [Thermoplasmata archaeon]
MPLPECVDRREMIEQRALYVKVPLTSDIQDEIVKAARASGIVPSEARFKEIRGMAPVDAKDGSYNMSPQLQVIFEHEGADRGVLCPMRWFLATESP